MKKSGWQTAEPQVTAVEVRGEESMLERRQQHHKVSQDQLLQLKVRWTYRPLFVIVMAKNSRA